MALSDLFLRGNPEKREKIIRRSQELIDLMKDNFEATNSLTEIVNKHLHSSFSPITLNEKATVKENCDVMIERVNQILANVEEVDEKMKKKLGPTLYEKLQHMSLKDFNKIPAVDKAAITLVCQISAGVLVAYLIKKKIILKTVTSIYCKIASGICASIVIGLAVDVIVSAIVGYIEQRKLDTALAEYDQALAVFRPASKEYQKAIYKVTVMLEFLE
ncbi:single-pass membrane and coiled-coil domain-containing protein 3-like [Sinocyclocheilus anshuiensis]|uniref:Single-pass membrane and coiled-coil domain-containing protein 3-like n=1 Tax=Sinocyclocheilus anshuiensis TaxID=1608454 RepID=A0A671M4G4_9TELE|nr:PREDICTED: single-pass membrane and coiled-coil domain-containing protein 3-like [Sinocyclocheilus anshuiensis]XP_016339970.1 PREDICTED: single-pass membrane and coiled-coil domain-containing protein 3-like [Sinocyclocheilus anshuiensis]